MVTIIFNVKSEMNNIDCTIKGSFEGQSNWNIDLNALLGM